MKKQPMPWSHIGLAALIALAIVVACDKRTPSGPSGPPTAGGPSGSPPAQAPTAVRIEGPPSVAPGTSAQYRAIASFSDGTTNDVTSSATWTTANSSVLTVGPAGIVQAKSRGESALDARYFNRAGHTYVLVLEDGTYRLTGRVSESGGGLEGARVAVVTGTGAGLNAVTASNGSYALYGVAGEVVIEAGLEGFDKTRQTIVISGNATADLTLRPTVAPTDLSGSWRMTLKASSRCAPAVPEDAATRSYGATIEQTGTFLRIGLKSPSLPTGQVGLEGRVVERRLTVFLPRDDFYYATYGLRYYSLVETLAPTSILGIAGTARGDRVGAAVSGTLDGEFSLYGTAAGSGVRNRYLSCTRGDHSFRLDRN